MRTELPALTGYLRCVSPRSTALLWCGGIAALEQQSIVDRRIIFPRRLSPVSARLMPSSLSSNWWVRMFRGWRCRRELNRFDVSPMVHALYDHGENYAALAACEQMQQEQPQNVYAYVHAIDLAMRCHRNMRRAQRSLNRGREVLRNASERDLLECFHLYATSLMGRL